MRPSHRLIRKILGYETRESPQNPRAKAGSPSCVNLSLLLELVVRSALQKTSAAGAAVAFIQGNTLICRARAGKITPDLDTVQDARSGLTGTCVCEGRVLNCEDTHTDSRVNAAVCQELGIRSILVVPILRSKTVLGVIELLSQEARAFGAEEDRWLEQVAELICDLSPEIVPADVGDRGQQETAQPKADQGEAKLSDLVQLLQESSPTARWDEIRQRLVSQR